MPHLKHLLVAVVALPLLAITAYACADDNDAEGESGASQESIDALATSHQMSSMMYSSIMMSSLGLHDIDEELNATNEIDPGYVPAIRTLVRLTSLTDWHSSLDEDAEALNASSVAFLQALQDGDVEGAKPLAGEVHDLEHDFSGAVWEIVAADLPADAGGVEAHGDDEEEGDDHGDAEEDDHGDEEDAEDDGHSDDDAESEATP
jgi:hypothetical protein